MSEQDILDNWGNEDEAEKPMPLEKISDLENAIERAYLIETELDAANAKYIDPLKKEKHELELKILATLEHFNKNSYKTQFGQVIRVKKFSVTFPKTPEDKQKLIDFMGQDNFIDMATINFNSFNSYYKQQIEAAAEVGNLGFELPGAGKPKFVEHLQKRKS